MNFTYLLQPPKKFTFEMPRVREYVEQNCKGQVLNLFAGKTKLNVDEFRVDLSNEFNPDFVGDAYDFVATTDLKFDTIVFDPPYNLRKAREKYDGRYVGSLTKIKNILPRTMNEGAKIISFGYDTVGMSKSIS